MSNTIESIKNLRKKYPNAILLFLVGGFYEAYNEDAVKVSEKLEIVLSYNKEGKITGFPASELSAFLPELIKDDQAVVITQNIEPLGEVPILVDPYDVMLHTALEAAEKAFLACVPTPQTFYSADLQDRPLEKIGEPDLEGDCGGAYITGIHGNDPFIKWCKYNKRTIAQKGVYKGYDILIPWPKTCNSQSAERHEAGAKAYAKVLNDHGVTCHIRAYLT